MDGLAQAFRTQGALFAVTAESERLLESAARFGPHLFLLFSEARDAAGHAAVLRSDPRFARAPRVLVSDQPHPEIAGITRVMPAQVQRTEVFAQEVLRLLKRVPVPAPAPRLVLDLPRGAETAAALAPIANTSTRAAKVLLVDDDPALLQLFALVFRKAGFETMTARDGEVGLALTLQHRPDLVIADLNMPRLDGWGLLRALRADHRVGETPVMFLSCHDDYRESLRAVQAGAQDYLAKGGRLDALVARVRKELTMRDAFRSGIAANQRIRVSAQEVGVQWAIRTLSELRATGTVMVTDPFWSIRLDMVNGTVSAAFAAMGHEELDGDAALSGEAALAAVVTLRGGELFFDPTMSPKPRNLSGELHSMLDLAAMRNNTAEAAALKRLMATAATVEIDGPLFEIYSQLAAPSSREIADLIRAGQTPNEIVTRTECSSMDVEETLRDLIRRQVIRLKRNT